jgi:hypothetical protein
MRSLLRHLLLAGVTVAVLSLALVGTGALGAGAKGSGSPTDPDLAGAANELLAADTTSASPTSDRPTTRQIRRLAAWQRLVHATATLDLPAAGGLTTVQLDHGTIAAVSSTSLTISEAGGGSVTVALGDATRVRRGGAKAAIGDLAKGDEVFTMSRVESDGTEAYLVVVPRA